MVYYGNLLDEEGLRSRWSDAIEKLKEFSFNIIYRDELSEETSPTNYNEEIFQEWRRQLSLEIVDLTDT